MARTLLEQVEGLTGLTINGSSAPDWSELGQFLKDGVKDVANRVIGLMPDKKIFFSKVDTDTGGGVLITGDVLSVTRNNGTSNLPCTRISSNLVGLVSDSTSMHYKSAHNPAWYIKENIVKVVPAATSSNTASVEYIGYDDNITENNLTIQHMPDEYYYLVVMYAGIKSLENALSAISITTFVEPAAFVAPASLSDTDVSFSEVGTFPSFIKPVFSAPSLDSVGSLNLPSVPVQPVLSAPAVSFSHTAPTYTGPVVAPDFSDANTWLNTEEDSEMVASRVQIISAQIQEYQADIQSAVNTFNKENAEYQAQLQVSIQNAQLDNQDEALKIQKYSTEVQAYQAEVNAEIQKWTNEEWTQKFQKYSADYGQLIAEYGQNIQNETARVQNEAQDYQQKVSKALQEYQAETGYDVAKQNADLQSAVQRFTQDLGKQNAVYQAEVSKKTSEYQWMQSRQQGLKQEYAQAFAMMAPSAQPQQQQRG